MECSGTFHHKTRGFIGLFGGKLSENTVSVESKIIFGTFKLDYRRSLFPKRTVLKIWHFVAAMLALPHIAALPLLSG